MNPVRIDGREIPEATIAAEMQNHRARDAAAARAEAVRALVVRELLLNEARRWGLSPAPQALGEGRREADDEALIRELLDARLEIRDPSEESCRAYYDSHPERFQSPDMFEAAHILISADPGDREAYADAVARAEAILELLKKDPESFAAIARERSDCTSGKNGGALGQVSRGDTAPEFETFLFALEPGEICPVPVKSRYGVHVLRLDRRIAGRTLPYRSVRGRIAAFLGERAWRRDVQGFVAALAAAARIDGVDPATLAPAAPGR